MEPSQKFNIVFFFCTAGSQVRAGMRCFSGIFSCSAIAALPLAHGNGLGRVCLVL